MPSLTSSHSLPPKRRRWVPWCRALLCLASVALVGLLNMRLLPMGWHSHADSVTMPHTPVIGNHTCQWRLANTSVAVTESFINEVLSAETPSVERAVRNITIPPQQVEHADVESMNLANFSLRNLSIRLAVPSTPFHIAEARGVGVVIGETNFTAHVLLSTCRGVFWANMTNMTLSMPFRLHHFDNGTPYTELSEATLTDGNFTFDHRLDSAMCRVAKSVVELFMGEINAMVERKTIEALQTQLPGSVQSQLNEQLNELPLFFYVDPLAERNRLLVSADLIRGRTSPPTSTASALPVRDLAVELPEYTVNNYLEDLRCREALTFHITSNWTTDDVTDVFPTLATLCPHCSLEAVVSGNAGRTTLRFNSPTAASPAHSRGSAVLRTQKLQFGVLMRVDTPRSVRHIRHTLAASTDVPEESSTFMAHFFHLDTGAADNETRVPLIVLEVNLTASAQDIHITGATQDQLAFHINRMTQLDLAVMASNIGNLDGQVLADVRSLVDTVVIPLLNTRSPYSVAPRVRHAVLRFGGDSVVIAGNVSYVLPSAESHS